MLVELTPHPFDPWQRLSAHETALAAQGRFGALVSFTGTMRDFNLGEAVTALELEHYPGMTERHLQDIAAEAAQRWSLVDALIIHRHGPIEPGQTIVLTAAWAAHRAEAFEACRYLIEELKHRAPFWKRETLRDGSRRWVERNT